MARGLAGWCVGVLVYQVLTWWLADTFDAGARASAHSSSTSPTS
jgi:hypothetical protein